MKTKLLKKVRSKVTLQERNNQYYIFVNGDCVFRTTHKESAFYEYKYYVIDFAKDLVPLKMKNKIR